MSIKVLLLNPIKPGQDFNVNVDPVIIRHTGAQTKAGIFSPLGLMYIASILRNNKIEVKIIDPVPEGRSFESVLDIGKEFDIIIVPLATSNISGTIKLFDNLKGKIRVLIGTYATVISDQLLRENKCDIVVNGEAEMTLLELCKAEGSPKDIIGLSYIKDYKVIKNSDRPLIEDLDSLPFPARDLIDNNLYSDIFFGKPTALVLTSRGCPYECSFCSVKFVYGRRLRVRSVKNIIEELEEIVFKYCIKNIFFIDDIFPVNEDRVIQICDAIIKHNLKISWVCNCHINLITKRMLEHMEKAGCKEIRYGIESASADILKGMKKNITPQQAIKVIRMTKEVGIIPSGFFMIGFPGETVEMIRDTVNFAKMLNPLYAVFTITIPAPGSELYYSLPFSKRTELVDKFDTVNSDTTNICGIEPYILTRELKRAYISFYLSWRFFCNFMSQAIQRPSAAVSVLRMLLQGGIKIFN
ncbi:MAG: radical SAM protein [Candidatus Omnitrophota bacterium]|nr:radical SAM protein [Candidatus Omnitrophota bacterium]